LTRRGNAALTRRELREVLRLARERGFATEHGEITAGFESVAVPVLDRVGWPLAAIALTFPEGTVGVERLAREAHATAVEISRRLRV
jgi:DNA-binding IclR family transcriptional regulator